MEKTYLFYDIETTGLNKSFDQIIQFAAIRTNRHLEELARHEYIIRLNPDVVPSPRAFITHRISPSQLEKGLDEFTAIKKIHSLMNTPGTISIGYNSLGFDDEFLRFSFYRNLLPPYTHQYANYCSRMDLYPITVMYFLFKNDLLKWPKDNLKLENLSKENELATGVAHNAMVDVMATVNLARCLRQDSKTWDYVAGYFDKDMDFARCDKIAKNSIAIMIDGKFGHAQQYQCPVMPLGMHHHYKNQFIWLRLDNENLTQATCDDFVTHTWVINKKIGEQGYILPMKERFLHEYLKGQQAQINNTLAWLQQNQAIMEKIDNYYRHNTYPKIMNIDVDAMLYEKGFLSTRDQEICQKIHLAQEKDKLNFLSAFSETYLQEILIRIMGRNFPEALSGEAKIFFSQYMESIKSSSESEGNLDYRGRKRLTPKIALAEIATLSLETLDDEQHRLLSELRDYIQKNF